MTVTTHFSNRIEILCDRVLAMLETPLDDPLATEYVLVDNRVMGQWLNLQLAQKHGVAANIHYIQPHELFWLLARTVISADIPEETPLSKPEMTWRLYSLFGNDAVLEQEMMKPVRNYLGGADSPALNRYQLAALVADLFDQYLVYRPAMLLGWEEGATTRPDDVNEAWQKILWCAISENQQHRAVIERKLLEALDKQTGDIRQKIPLQRLTVFGVTSMPPHLIDMLMLLGKHIPVDLFVMNPCREYWFDIQSEKVLAKNAGKRVLGEGVIGNPLLASQGQQVREFIEALYTRNDQYELNETENYCGTDRKTLLHCIQQEILDLQYQGGMAQRNTLSNDAQKQLLPDADRDSGIRSVRVHSCHSALREVEVLHDQLLAMFKQDSTLKPRDVVVMMPQVAPYVPYINTVFGATVQALPYHITDRNWLEEVPLLHSLGILLALPDSRLPLTDILALLEVPAIQARFNIDREGFKKLKNWLHDSGARWGLDATHREKEDLPAYGEFSWEFAVNRLLAGYGMTADNEPLTLADGNSGLAVMPFDEVEGSGAELLNGFLQFWEALLLYRNLLSQAANTAEWSVRISALLDTFIEPQTDEEQLALRAICREVHAMVKAKNWYGDIVDIAVVRAVLQPVLQAPAQGGHPWREGIKFCSLMPMRGVPFCVVCVLGMNQSDYPKRSAQSSFDLMRNDYRAGDRSRRLDDRWLFLEALLSARDMFHVSYIGRDQRKNEVRQPSIVLAELLDYLRHGYCLPDIADPDGRQLLKRIVIEHPLQPFNPVCFQEKIGRQSFNKQAFAIASHKVNHSSQSVSSCEWKRSTQKTQQVTEVSLDSFVQFFVDPAQWFFRDRCNRVSLRLEDETVSDSETFEIKGGLESWSAKDELLQLADSIDPADDEPELRINKVLNALELTWKAEGRWPLGSGGDNFREKLANEVNIGWLDARRAVQGEPVTYTGQCELATAQGVLLVRGELACLGETFFFHTASKKSSKYQLKLAIQSAFAGETMPRVKDALAVFFGDKKQPAAKKLSEKPNQQFLKALAGLYMQYHEHGLPFLLDVSLEYRDEYQENRDKWEEVVDKTWDSSALGIQELAYYMSRQRLLSDTFIEVAQTMSDALQQWEAGGTQV